MVAGPAPGVSAQGRSKTYKRRGLWAIKKKHGGEFPKHPKQEKAASPAAKVIDESISHCPLHFYSGHLLVTLGSILCMIRCLHLLFLRFTRHVESCTGSTCTKFLAVMH